MWNRTLWRVCFRCLLPWVKSNTNCIFFVYPQMVILQPLQNLTKRRRLKTILPFSVEHCFSGLIDSSWRGKIGKLTAKMCGTWILNTGKPLSIFSCKKETKALNERYWKGLSQVLLLCGRTYFRMTVCRKASATVKFGFSVCTVKSRAEARVTIQKIRNFAF